MSATGWICSKCGASLADWMSWCPCSPPMTIGPGTSNAPQFATGCPSCGRQFPGKCSCAGCPNYGTTC